MWLWLWLWLGLWLRLGLNLTLLLTMIIEHYRHIITHFKYVHNASWIGALSKMLPRFWPCHLNPACSDLCRYKHFSTAFPQDWYYAIKDDGSNQFPVAAMSFSKLFRAHLQECLHFVQFLTVDRAC